MQIGPFELIGIAIFLFIAINIKGIFYSVKNIRDAEKANPKPKRTLGL